jgi:hypothetical protein
MAEIYIGDYFKTYDEESFSYTDWKIVNSIRNKINSFKNEKDIYNFLFDRRLNSFNKSEDQRLFDIDSNNTINPMLHPDIVNRYYGMYIGNYNKEDNEKQRDYYKRNLRGEIKRDKNGKGKEYGKVGQSILNISDHFRENKFIKLIAFAIQHPMAHYLFC